MKRARFTEKQIIGVLREHEAGTKAADLARRQALRLPPAIRAAAATGRVQHAG